jgi:hypothetical protein
MLRATRHGWTPRQLSIDAELPIPTSRRTARKVETLTTLVAKPLKAMAGATGLEPATFGVTGRQFNMQIQALFRLFDAQSCRHFGSKSERRFPGVHLLWRGLASPACLRREDRRVLARPATRGTPARHRPPEVGTMIWASRAALGAGGTNDAYGAIHNKMMDLTEPKHEGLRAGAHRGRPTRGGPRTVRSSSAQDRLAEGRPSPSPGPRRAGS